MMENCKLSSVMLIVRGTQFYRSQREWKRLFFIWQNEQNRVLCGTSEVRTHELCDMLKISILSMKCA